jgi:hypothetical protein
MRRGFCNHHRWTADGASLPQVYVRKPCGEAVSAVANALAMKALDGRLAIYAGAGVSRAAPTNLPMGAGLADEVAAALAVNINGLRAFEPGNLLDLADAVEEQPGGRDLLQEALVRLARFDEADPNDAHRVLAMLALEGLATVLTTNWDDCVERAAPGGRRLQVVVSDDDYAHVRGATVMKLHGCVSRRGSLLVSSSDLVSPPPWVTTEVGPRLAAGTTVFIGIGDVAEYVKVRLKQVLEAMGGTGADVRLVGPGVIARWSDLAWSAIPEANLPPENRVEQTAEEFLDELLRALVRVRFADMRRELAECVSSGVATADGGQFIDKLEQVDALSAIAWLREVFVRLPAGQQSDGNSLRTVILALGRLVAAGAEPLAEGWLRSDDTFILVVVGDGSIPAPRLAQEVEARVRRARSRGLLSGGDAVVAICAGYRGSLLAGPIGGAVGSILDTEASSVVHADANPTTYVDANLVLSGGAW